MQPAVYGEAGIAEGVGGAVDGHDLMADPGGEDKERVLSGRDGAEGRRGAWGTDRIESDFAAGERLGLRKEIVDGGEHAGAGWPEGEVGSVYVEAEMAGVGVGGDIAFDVVKRERTELELLEPGAVSVSQFGGEEGFKDADILQFQAAAIVGVDDAAAEGTGAEVGLLGEGPGEE